MRVSLVNLNLSPKDAIGACLLNQVRYFRRLGDDVRVYVMHPPEGVPGEVAALAQVVSAEDLRGGRQPHFAHSDLHVYHYPRHYGLLESIHGIERGAVIFYYHNVTPPELWGSAFERDELQHSRDVVGAYAHSADLVATDSPFNAEDLVANHGCEPERVRVLPLSVPLEQFKPGPRDVGLLARYGLEGRRVILFVGRMAGNKRVDLLVEALDIVREQVPKTVLLLVGDDASNPALRETAASVRARADGLGLADAVIWTGRVDDLPAYYRLADVYVSASLHEGFDVPLVEAMASGVPVVASRAAAHPWVVGQAGLLSEPGDAADLAGRIVQLLTDDGLCGDRVRRGLARAREFSPEHYDAGWAAAVAEATAWMPLQVHPRPATLEARSMVDGSQGRAEPPSPPPQEQPVGPELAQLEAASDVMLRGYQVRSKLPLVGGVVAWIRRNLTSHLREPYLDPTLERQVAFNRQVAGLLRQILEQAAMQPGVGALALPERGADLNGRLTRLEARLDLIVAELALLSAQGAPQPSDADIERMREQVEALRAELGKLQSD